MRKSQAVLWLTLLIAVVAGVVAAIGLFAHAGDGAYAFTTLRGATATIYGKGQYRYDTLLVGAGFRGGDAVTFFVGIPVLLLSLWGHRRGSLRSSLILVGALAYFLYIYTSLVFGAAFNPLFMLYLVVFAASLFAFVIAALAVDQGALAARLDARFRRRGVASFMFVIGFVLLIVWLGLTWLPSFLTGDGAAHVDSYTTVVTYVLDLGIIVPFALLTGVYLWQRRAPGYLFAAIMLNLSWLLGLAIAASTVAQVVEGYPYTPGQLIGLVAPFVLMTVVGGWLALHFHRSIGAERLVGKAIIK